MGRERGAPEGNQNAAKGKRWTAAIERAIDRYEHPDSAPPSNAANELMRGIDAAADAFVAKMMESHDIAFFREFGDRIEGKPKQAVEHSQDPDNPLLPLQGIETLRTKIRGESA